MLVNLGHTKIEGINIEKFYWTLRILKWKKLFNDEKIKKTNLRKTLRNDSTSLKNFKIITDLLYLLFAKINDEGPKDIYWYWISDYSVFRRGKDWWGMLVNPDSFNEKRRVHA